MPELLFIMLAMTRLALSLAAFVIGLVEHDYQTTAETFERALALSPSSAFTLFTSHLKNDLDSQAERQLCALAETLPVHSMPKVPFLDSIRTYRVDFSGSAYRIQRCKCTLENTSEFNTLFLKTALLTFIARSGLIIDLEADVYQLPCPSAVVGPPDESRPLMLCRYLAKVST
jgi:hypothetical protein